MKVVISGSFHRDPEGLQRLYRELLATGCQVLSPLGIPELQGKAEFIRADQDYLLSDAEIEKQHLRAICHADALWLHAPEGYIGTSCAFEVGFAVAKGKPVFAQEEPRDGVFGPYVQVYRSVFESKETFHGTQGSQNKRQT